MRYRTHLLGVGSSIRFASWLWLLLRVRVMLGRRLSSLRDGGGVRGVFSLPYLFCGGVAGGVASSPEDGKGSVRVWTTTGKSEEGREDTETQERGVGKAETRGGRLFGLGL